MGLLAALNAYRGGSITFFSQQEADQAREILAEAGIHCTGIDCSIVNEFCGVYIGAVYTFNVTWGQYGKACNLLREAGIL